MTEHLLTSRSRNLGFGWSNQPSGRDALSITAPTAPDAVGGLRSVENELSRAIRLNSGNYWSGRLFIAGKAVVARWGVYETAAGWQQGWVCVDRLDFINEILTELREGGSVRVRTEAP